MLSIYYTGLSSSSCLQEELLQDQPTAFIWLPTIRNYYGIKPTTSSRLEVGIIHMDGELFYYTISPLFLFLSLTSYNHLLCVYKYCN